MTSRKSDYEKFLAKTSVNIIQCRTFGHRWNLLRATRDKRGAYSLNSECENNCGVEKFQFVNARGYITGTHYIYPNEYLFSGHGNLSSDDRALARLELIARIWE